MFNTSSYNLATFFPLIIIQDYSGTKKDVRLTSRVKEEVFKDLSSHCDWPVKKPLSFDANVSSFSLAESPPCDLQITATNNGVLMRNVIQLFLSANTILLMHK